MNKYMKMAKDAAEENLNTKVGGPFGAVIVKKSDNGDEVVGIGSNRVITDSDPTAHAEITAIRNATKKLKTHDLSECELYTSCYPCPMCMSAIIWANIKTVYYGNTKEDAAELGFRDDMIYRYFKSGESDIVNLKQVDRNETIETFNKYKDQDGRV